jgi:hypothetical protein
MKWVFVLMVFVVDDGIWREWNNYSTLKACEEIVTTITYHREEKIKAYCLAREVNE